MEQKLSQEIIDAAPEGATHVLHTNGADPLYYRRGDRGQSMASWGWNDPFQDEDAPWPGESGDQILPGDSFDALPSTLIRKPAHKQEPDPQLGKGDAQGIERFVAPPDTSYFTPPKTGRAHTADALLVVAPIWSAR